MQIPVPTRVPTTKKRLLRRSRPDRSQRLRLGVQLAFVVLNVWIGVQFYLWVRHFETLGASRLVERPAGVEGWLPVASLMSLKYLLITGLIPEIHPAGLFLLLAFLLIAAAFRKAFCSWLCPIGTLSEYLWKLGRSAMRNFTLPRWADIPLRSLKYLLLAFFVFVIAKMEVTALESFLASPYALIADVKMLNFFRVVSTTTATVLAALILLSVFVPNFWCRYLCPYGALMGIVSLLSPVRIRREAAPCIDCARCANACPSHLPVDKLVQIRSAECSGCLECVAVCPAEGALYSAFRVPLLMQRNRRVSAGAFAVGVAIVFLGITGWAKATGHWRSNVPYAIYQQLVPTASKTSHPDR